VARGARAVGARAVVAHLDLEPPVRARDPHARSRVGARVAHDVRQGLLVGMRERAEALGGSFEAGAARDGAFRVWARLPPAAA
jgi:hypothetical protein